MSNCSGNRVWENTLPIPVIRTFNPICPTGTSHPWHPFLFNSGITFSERPKVSLPMLFLLNRCLPNRSVFLSSKDSVSSSLFQPICNFLVLPQEKWRNNWCIVGNGFGLETRNAEPLFVRRWIWKPNQPFFLPMGSRCVALESLLYRCREDYRPENIRRTKPDDSFRRLYIQVLLLKFVLCRFFPAMRTYFDLTFLAVPFSPSSTPSSVSHNLVALWVYKCFLLSFQC